METIRIYTGYFLAIRSKAGWDQPEPNQRNILLEYTLGDRSGTNRREYDTSFQLLFQVGSILFGSFRAWPSMSAEPVTRPMVL